MIVGNEDAHTGLFVYPWDLVQDGLSGVLDVSERLGAARVDIAITYHSGELLRPRSANPTYAIEANRLHLPLAADADDAAPGGRIGYSTLAADHPRLFPDAVEQAAARNIRVGGWVTLLHNSTAAAEDPGLAIQDCFGTRSTHGLCPASPEVKEYSVRLVSALARTQLFDRLLIESPSYLMAGHGHPHEIHGVADNPLPRFLRSLCLCAHCRARYQSLGIDAEQFAASLRTLLRQIWNASAPGRGTSPADLAGLIQAWAELRIITTDRQRAVTQLVRDLVRVASEQGVRLMVNTATWAGTLQDGWQEGLDPVGIAESGAGLLVPMYGRTIDAVHDELAFLRSIRSVATVPETAVALRLWPVDHGSPDAFATKLAAIRDDDSRPQVMFYNYSTATTATLQWATESAAR